MAVSPSTDNYTLGKGVVFFDQKNQTTGLYMGERDLGNAPAFAFNTAIEKLDHYSSRGGLKAKDKEIISQITPGVTFTLDEINKQNLALLTLGELNEVTQVAGGATAEAVTAHLGLRSDLANRNIGHYALPYDDSAADNVLFVVGETVSGATGEGVVVALAAGSDATSGTLYIALTTPGFVDDETITGDVAGTAEVNSATGEVLQTGVVILVQDDADTITYEAGAEGVGNYQINTDLKDGVIGRILINADQTSPTNAIAEGDVLHITYGFFDAEYTEIRAFNNTQVEGKLRFVSDNPAGTQQELEIWRCSLTPTGDTAMIGDDWSTLGFTGEILKDEVGHPEAPYMVITMD